MVGASTEGLRTTVLPQTMAAAVMPAMMGGEGEVLVGIHGSFRSIQAAMGYDVGGTWRDEGGSFRVRGEADELSGAATPSDDVESRSSLLSRKAQRNNIIE